MKKIEILTQEINRIDEAILVLMDGESLTAAEALAYYREHMELNVIALKEFKKLPCISSEKFKLEELIKEVNGTIIYFIFEYFEDHTEADFKQQFGLHFTDAMKQWYTFICRFRHYCSN